MKCSLKQNGSRSGKFKKFEKKTYKKQSKGVCITAVAPRQLSQMSTHTLSQTLSNNVSTLSPVTVANNVIVTRKPLTDAEKIMNDPILNAIDTCCRNNHVPVTCSPLCNISYAEKVLDESWDWGEYKKTCKEHKKKIGICHIGGKQLNATEDEQKDLAKKGRSLMKSNVTVTGRQLSGDKKSPELKLQGVLVSDNGTVHIPDILDIPETPVIITGQPMPQPLINATKNESSSQASKSSKIESMRVKTKAREMTRDLEEKCSDNDKECQKRAEFMKNDDPETESDAIESSKKMRLEFETEVENAEGDAVEEQENNDEEGEEGSGEEEGDAVEEQE